MKNQKLNKKKSKNSMMIPVSTVIKNKWKIQGKLGQGAFGEIYAAVDIHSQESVAIKVEKNDNKKMVLKLEVIAIKKLQSCRHVVRYFHSGRHEVSEDESYNFLVMERLGENIADLRKKTPNGCFSLCTTIKLGIQMLEGIEGVHKLGYLHRDIKPSNFLMGKPKSVNKDRVYLIDFGLARKYKLPSGDIRPPRKNAGFRGTARYASINSHRSKDLGRKDDLWSLFYVFVEFLLGSLPWKNVRDKEHVGQLKERYTNEELVKDLPTEFIQFMEHLQKLSFSDEPDYDYLRTILFKIYARESYPPDAPYDWEINNKLSVPKKIDFPSIIDVPVHSNLKDKEKKDKQQIDEYYNVFKENKDNKNKKGKRNKVGCQCIIL